MNVAILTISSLALGVGIVNLAIMAKTAKELKAAKTEVESQIEVVKAKVNHNAKVVKTALSALEM